MNNLKDFVEYELYPALYERIDSAFPLMDFKRRGGNWHSKHYLNGQPHRTREDKTVVTKEKPHLIHEQGGDSLTLISYYLQITGHNPKAKGAEYVEAVKALAGICGLTPPENDSEEYRAYRERQEKMEAVASTMQSALFTDEGWATLDYLKTERGYSEEEIKAMGLGFCSQNTAKELEGAPYGAGTDYTLAIPYRSGGRILGFKLRAICPQVSPKYKNTVSLPKKASIFGLTGLRLTGNGRKDRDLTIVEGELDALRAQIKGVDNIAASAGLYISQKALQEAKRRGVERITILVDSEASEEEQARKQGDIASAINAVGEAGLLPMVAVLPAGRAGEKVDTDSFLNTHSVQELQKVIDEASTGAKYLFQRIYEDTVVKQTGGTITDKVYDDYKKATIALLNNVEVVSPTDRDFILTQFAASTGKDAGITPEALQAEADARKRIEDKKRQETKAKELLQKASELAAKGDIQESIALLSESLPDVKKIAKEADYTSLLVTPTAQSIRERLRNRPEGIKTGYEFSSGGRSERLLLPSGALTLVAAPTSHGKSTLLRNLALQTAGNGEEGSVLYFSFEEDMESTVVEFVNTFVGLELTHPSRDYNNLTTIMEYYRTNSTQYIKNAVEAEFIQKEADFMRDYIESGNLRIFDNDYSSGELINVIKYAVQSIKVKAIFVDYVQLLYKEGNRLQRNEELKEIAKDLRQTAKSLKLPIILAAQLNRDAKSPVEMHSQNIADSADLEREANKVILLWNSTFNPLNGNTYEKEKFKIDEVKRPVLGIGGKIYARLAKNRGGIAYIDALLDYNGNTGRIEANYTESSQEEDLPKEEEQKPASLF